MKNFIEELYYGNLEPQARAIKPNTEVKRQMNVLDNAETKLMALLSGKEKDLFCRYVSAWATVQQDATLDFFINSFRMGAKFTYDAFESNQSPFEKLTEKIVFRAINKKIYRSFYNLYIQMRKDLI